MKYEQVYMLYRAAMKIGHVFILGLAVKSEQFYVAAITRVSHFCMGGLDVDVNFSVIGTNGKAIAGLHDAVELAGGIIGNNRLGGNSTLDCATQP